MGNFLPLLPGFTCVGNPQQWHHTQVKQKLTLAITGLSNTSLNVSGEENVQSLTRHGVILSPEVHPSSVASITMFTYTCSRFGYSLGNDLGHYMNLIPNTVYSHYMAYMEFWKANIKSSNRQQMGYGEQSGQKVALHQQNRDSWLSSWNEWMKWVWDYCSIIYNVMRIGLVLLTVKKTKIKYS